MTTAFWCLFIVILLPFPLAFTGAYLRGKAFGSVDNKNPRTQIAALEGIGARAYAAQENAWEASVLFSAAVVISHLAGVNAAAAAPWAIAFVVFRVLHAIFYLSDIDLARSGVFIGGMACIVALFVLAA